MLVTLISHTINPEETITIAAKTCYSDQDISMINGIFKRNIFLGKLLDAQHLSPFEHASFTFGIEGISRACSHQLVRHRLASYSQKSQRYVRQQFPDNVVPESISNNGPTYLAYKSKLLEIHAFYLELIEKGIPEEDARYILPNACTTQLVMTMNARELMAFCQLRMCNKAQWEIQQLATNIAGLLLTEFPKIFKGKLLPHCLVFGVCREANPCGKPIPDYIKDLV